MCVIIFITPWNISSLRENISNDRAWAVEIITRSLVNNLLETFLFHAPDRVSLTPRQGVSTCLWATPLRTPKHIVSKVDRIQSLNLMTRINIPNIENSVSKEHSSCVISSSLKIKANYLKIKSKIFFMPKIDLPNIANIETPMTNTYLKTHDFAKIHANTQIH